MQQNVATCRALDSIQRQLLEPLSEEQIKAIYDHLYLLFGVGFNEGLKERNIHKAVEQYTKQKVICRYVNAMAAANYMGITRSSIYKAIKNPRRKCKGYYWRYA
jgi:hypothetical protein